jgi:hypothetical protein
MGLGTTLFAEPHWLVHDPTVALGGLNWFDRTDS